MRSRELVAFDFNADNTLTVALGVGLLASVLVYLLARYCLGVGDERQDRARLAKRRAEDDDRDPFLQASRSDRRNALRRGGNPIAVFITDAEGKGDPIHGYVLDRSTGGLCLAVGEPIEEGSIVSVKTTNAPITTPWIQIEVRNCRPISSSEWELGCKFEKTPPWSILLLFG